MSSERPSKLALDGHGAFAALAPLMRRAWALLAPRAKASPSDEASLGGVSIESDAGANDAEDIGRAENEGMPP
jgi:hypothetical protein